MKHLPFICIGRGPAGGLAGGDDIYICRRCYTVTDSPCEEQNDECPGAPTREGSWEFTNMITYREDNPNWKEELKKLEELHGNQRR